MFWLMMGLLLVVFTFLDPFVTSLLYNANSVFGSIVHYIAHIPSYTLMLMSVLMVFKYVSTLNIKYKVQWLVLIGLFYFVVGFMFMVMVRDLYGWFFSFIVVLAMMNLTLMVFSRMKDAWVESGFKVAVFYMVSLVLSFFVVYVIKSVWMRERFMSFEDVSMVRYWFEFQGFSGVYEHNSFPSGHVASAALMLVFWFVGKDFFKNNTVITFSVALWIVLVSIGRIVDGYHFMTDAVVSVMIVYGVMVLVDKWLLGYALKFVDLWKHRFQVSETDGV